MEGKLIKFKCDTKNGGTVYVFAPNKVTASFKCALQFGSCLSAVEVAEKSFDITQHEWSDNCISVERSNTDAGQIRLDNDMYLVDIERKDAIAIAKHFKLTAGDLK